MQNVGIENKEPFFNNLIKLTLLAIEAMEQKIDLLNSDDEDMSIISDCKSLLISIRELLGLNYFEENIGENLDFLSNTNAFTGAAIREIKKVETLSDGYDLDLAKDLTDKAFGGITYLCISMIDSSLKDEVVAKLFEVYIINNPKNRMYINEIKEFEDEVKDYADLNYEEFANISLSDGTSDESSIQDGEKMELDAIEFEKFNRK